MSFLAYRVQYPHNGLFYLRKFQNASNPWPESFGSQHTPHSDYACELYPIGSVAGSRKSRHCNV